MVLLENARARFEFEITDTYSAGMILTGAEVKSLRGKHGSLHGSAARIVNGEAWLLNAQISPYPFADNRDYDPKRTRKLLLTKKEILKLQSSSQQKGMQLVPLRVESVGPFIKLVLGIGKGRNARDKRAVVKKREQTRELQRLKKTAR